MNRKLYKTSHILQPRTHRIPAQILDGRTKGFKPSALSPERGKRCVKGPV
jgi:hypothetical protein